MTRLVQIRHVHQPSAAVVGRLTALRVHLRFSAFGKCRMLPLAMCALLLAGCEQRPIAPAGGTATSAAPAPAGASSTAAATDTRRAAHIAPAASQAVVTEKPIAGAPGPRAFPPRAARGTFVDRQDEAALRVVSYNVKWNSLFPDVDPRVSPRIGRILTALDPDVLALQEIGVHPQDREKSDPPRKTAADVQALLDRILPLPDGGRWHAYQGYTNVIASKYPLQLTRDQTQPPADRGVAIAYVDLPDERFAADLYLVNTHHKCCGGTDNDPQRQRQSDGIINWLRDAKESAGYVQIPPGTGLIILGDFNLVGGPQPLTTLLSGDISDETRFGADFAPDWDQTPLSDARPLHNIAGPGDWTWRDDNSEYKPGRLDYILYSDSVLHLQQAFALDTTQMSPEDLEKAGLQKLDVAKDEAGREYDHLPLVADFTFAPPAAAVE